MLNWCSVWVEHYASSELQLKVNRMDNIFWGLVAKYRVSQKKLSFCVSMRRYAQISSGGPFLLKIPSVL